MLEGAEVGDAVPLHDIPLESIPSDVLDIIRTHKAFSESATFGRMGIGSPEEYERLVISKEDRTMTFEYFNKGIHYCTAGTEEDRPVFQVFAQLMRLDDLSG
jgi:hypothetical protein